MTDRPIPYLTLIENDAEPQRSSVLDEVTCWVCERDVGIDRNGPWIAMTLSLYRENNGTITPHGTGYYCANCLRRGKLTRAL